MQTLHTVNLVIHVSLGTLGLLLGLITLIYQNQYQRHIRFGRYFLYALTVVVATALIGILFFRSNPFLLMLTLLGGYVGYSGYRSVRLKEKRSSPADTLLTISVLVASILYARSIQLAAGSWSPAVIYSTMSALWLVTGYDLIKHLWLYQRLQNWWLYEHIYKMMSAYSALASAFSGTVLSHFKPYSQILPSVVCILFIIYFIRKQIEKRMLTNLGD
ncbi:hypothetical protein WBJ53_11320 [Spirosoma sp. SC4-14]|uniref:hypothetical protein n=1 Tax=Spirosoma sp. SC4-14 TaxID=3128900 RepID=UPI0030D0379D